jgi:hypothetical protein
MKVAESRLGLSLGLSGVDDIATGGDESSATHAWSPPPPCCHRGGHHPALRLRQDPQSKGWGKPAVPADSPTNASQGLLQGLNLGQTVRATHNESLLALLDQVL